MPHASCSKPPKSTLELEIKCYGEIPPVALSLRSCCLCYRDLSHSVTPVRRPSRTAAASRRPNSPLILSAKDHLVTAEFPQEGFTESILAWADLMLLRGIQTTSSQDLREVRFSHYHCFCSQGCVRGGWLWQITCHCTWCDHSLAGNTSFPSHAWSFHETRYHTNQIVVVFSKTPFEFWCLLSPSHKQCICSFSSCWHTGQAWVPTNTIWSLSEFIFHF